jgi:DNA-binding transcriptional LysR family regulator
MIDVRRLHVLRTLARCKTVRATAEELHLSPSAVSQQISLFERELGVDLVMRDGRNIKLTGGALVLLEHAHEVFRELEGAQADLEAYRTGELGVTYVGAFASSVAGLVAPAVAEFCHSRSRWRVSVVQAEPEESIDRLLAGELDVAVTMSGRHLPDHQNGEVLIEQLLAEPYDAVVSSSHPLGRTACLDMALDLADQPLISSAPGTAWHDCVVAAAHQAGFQPCIAHTVDDFAAAVGLVQGGLGITVLPRLGWRGANLEGVTVRPVTPAPRRKIFAAVRRGSHLDALVEVLRQHGARIEPEDPSPPLPPHDVGKVV